MRIKIRTSLMNKTYLSALPIFKFSIAAAFNWFGNVRIFLFLNFYFYFLFMIKLIFLGPLLFFEYFLVKSFAFPIIFFEILASE